MARRSLYGHHHWALCEMNHLLLGAQCAHSLLSAPSENAADVSSSTPPSSCSAGEVEGDTHRGSARWHLVALVNQRGGLAGGFGVLVVLSVQFQSLSDAQFAPEQSTCLSAFCLRL